MLLSNLFNKFFKYNRSNVHEIIKYNSNENIDLHDLINNKLIEIDEKISENTKALLEAQVVKLRSTFTKSDNFIEKIGKNVYKTKLEESINWYKIQLKELYLKRKELRIKLEKIKGIYWLNQIKRFLKIILIGFFVLLSLFIFLSGFMIIIYLLPLIIIIFLGYFLITKKY